MDQKKIWEKV